jgi:hypothetical protein
MAPLRGKSGKSSDAATATSCAAVQPRVCIATTTAPQPFSLRPPHSRTHESVGGGGWMHGGPTEALTPRACVARRMAHGMARRTAAVVCWVRPCGVRHMR